jgi:undecaprenyl-diphosphatase
MLAAIAGPESLSGVSSHASGAPGGPLGSDGFLDVNDFARHTSWLHGVLSGYATYGVVLFAVLLIAGCLYARSKGRLPLMASALWAAGGMGVAIALNQLVIHAANEPRPFVALKQFNVLTLVHHTADPGFPSDHAVMAGAVAAGLVLVSRTLGWIATAAAILIAFARVYIGVHYPQDVLAGLALGAVVVLLTGLIMRPLLLMALTALARTPLRPTLIADRPLSWLHTKV